MNKIFVLNHKLWVWDCLGENGVFEYKVVLSVFEK